MNIFENMKALFIGPSCENITKYVNDFWKITSQMRTDLGKKGYYLDEYLSNIFEVMSRLDLESIGEAASDVCGNILRDCYIICELDTEKEKSEFFDLVKEYIDAHPVNFEHKHTQCEFYGANILIEHLNIFAEKTKLLYTKNILSGIDFIVCNKMYENISYLIVERRMEILNEAMCEAFIFSPIIVSAVQQIVTRGIQMLCYQDPESSKKLHHFMMKGEVCNG